LLYEWPVVCDINVGRLSLSRMLNLFSLKNKEAAEGGGAGAAGKKKASAAQLRITKDINELELPKTCRTEFPDPDDLLNFKLVIAPDEGFYRGGRFQDGQKVQIKLAKSAIKYARTIP
jgi:hypothetical protein